MKSIDQFSNFNSILSDFKDIKIYSNALPKSKKVSKPPTLSVKNSIIIKADQIMDFDLIDLETVYLIAILCYNSVIFYCFSKSAQKLSQERRKVFESKNDEPENLYSLSFGSLKTGETVLACGGEMGFIYIIYLEETRQINELFSNNGELFALSFSPIEDKSWLLAGYKNGYTVLWDLDVDGGIQIAEFRYFNQNPPSDVSCLDWHDSGNYFVVSHLDTRVIVWEIDEEIKRFDSDNNQINNDEKKKKYRKITKVTPIKESFDGHTNYVDCVKFWEDLLISKDVEGNLLLWSPFKETLFLLNVYDYEYYEAIWYVKFTVNRQMEVICLGNDNGEIFVYKIKEGTFAKENGENIPNKKKYLDIEKEDYDCVFRLEDERKVIRKVIITEDEKFLFCISDGGKFWWKSIKE